MFPLCRGARDQAVREDASGVTPTGSATFGCSRCHGALADILTPRFIKLGDNPNKVPKSQKIKSASKYYLNSVSKVVKNQKEGKADRF